MKVEVTSHRSFTLKPENDADYALLAFWSEQSARVSSSEYSNGRTHKLSIGFSDPMPSQPPEAS